MSDIAVVTGGAGFIGSHLCDALVAQGYTVRVIDDLSTGKKQNLTQLEGKIEFFQGSVLDGALLKKMFAGATYVFHLAAVPSVPRSIRDPLTSHEVNATGTLTVLLAARESGVQRVVYSASSSYYGDTPTLPKHEQMPPNPLSPYAVQKYVGEAYASMFTTLYGLSTVSLRYFNVFGPRQDPTSEYAAVIPRFISALRSGKAPTIYGDGSASRDFTYVDDAVAANLLAAKAPNVGGQIFNCAGGTQVTINEMLSMLQKLIAVSIQPVHTEKRPGDIEHSYADISRARQMLGFSPSVQFEEGLRRTVAAIN